MQVSIVELFWNIELVWSLAPTERFTKMVPNLSYRLLWRWPNEHLTNPSKSSEFPIRSNSHFQ